MVNKIPDDDAQNITPAEKIAYEKDYKQAARLFQKALQQHSKATDMYQRHEFEDVMDSMMQALNESARALKNENAATRQIQKDYETYQKQPTPEHKKQLDLDLERAKRSL